MNVLAQINTRGLERGYFCHCAGTLVCGATNDAIRVTDHYNHRERLRWLWDLLHRVKRGRLPFELCLGLLVRVGKFVVASRFGLEACWKNSNLESNNMNLML